MYTSLRLLLCSLLLASAAMAHNAARVTTGNGECVNVGSGRSGPLVPDQNPNRNERPGDPDQGRLDKMPETRGDQYGARYAAEKNDTLSGGHSAECRN